MRRLLLVSLLAAACLAQDEARPNILFAIADDWGLHAGAYGTPWVETPHFDRVAREGVLFTRAFTPNAKCSPSRASILTGRNPWQNGAAANHWPYYPEELVSWVEALAAGGWFTGHTGKGWGPGDIPAARRGLVGRRFQQGGAEPPTAQIARADYAGGFAAFLDARPEGAPFCFWYGGYEPHRPYARGSGAAVGGYDPAKIDRVPAYWPDEADVRGDMLDYALEVKWFDEQLGRMLAELERRGLLERTVVVVTSDNGMPFPRVKGHPFAAACHLPLAVRWGGGVVAPGRRCDELVSFIDFAPTFLELAGVDAGAAGMKPVQGRSFVDLLRDAPAGPRPRITLGRERNDVYARAGEPFGPGYPVRALVEDGWLYLHNFEPGRWPCGDPDRGLQDTDAGPTKAAIERRGAEAPLWQLAFGRRPAEELYDLRADPDCVRNLAGDPASAAEVARLRAALFAELEAQGDPRLRGGGAEFDRYPSPRPRRDR